MKQFKININDLFEKSEVETMMDDVEKSSIIYEMNNINQKVLNEISTYANNRERIQNLTDEFTEIMYHERISNNDVERIDYIFDQLVHHIGLDAPVLAACTNTIFNTINEYKEEYSEKINDINEKIQELGKEGEVYTLRVFDLDTFVDSNPDLTVDDLYMLTFMDENSEKIVEE